jgi:hypothetical protein
MRYTVTWHPSAEREVLERWLTADSATRGAITNASNRLDKLLAVDPQSKGTQIIPFLYEATIAPLFVRYHVSEPDRRVTVLTVDFV